MCSTGVEKKPVFNITIGVCLLLCRWPALLVAMQRVPFLTPYEYTKHDAVAHIEG